LRFIETFSRGLGRSLHGRRRRFRERRRGNGSFLFGQSSFPRVQIGLLLRELLLLLSLMLDSQTRLNLALDLCISLRLGFLLATRNEQ